MIVESQYLDDTIFKLIIQAKINDIYQNNPQLVYFPAVITNDNTNLIYNI